MYLAHDQQNGTNHAKHSWDNEAKLMTKLAPEWVRTSDPVIRRPARYRWTTAPAFEGTRVCDSE